MIDFDGDAPNFDLDDADGLNDSADADAEDDGDEDAPRGNAKPEGKTLDDYSPSQRNAMYAFYEVMGDAKKVARKFKIPLSLLLTIIKMVEETDTDVPKGDAPEQKPVAAPAMEEVYPDVWQPVAPDEDADDEADDEEEPVSYDRPYPPEWMQSPHRKPAYFLPAPEVNRWFRRVFVDEDGPLYNPALWYFRLAKIGFLWTNLEKRNKGQFVAGTAEIPLQSVKEKWAKGRAEQQYIEWFGCVPDFVIHLDAVYCGMCDDRLFCSLTFHEGEHCFYKTDKETGEMLLNEDKETGEQKPSWIIVGHHLEEFVTCMELFGVAACAGKSVDFVKASKRKPKYTDADIARACGRDLDDLPEVPEAVGEDEE